VFKINNKNIKEVDELLEDIQDTINYMVDTPTNILVLKRHIKHIEVLIAKIKELDVYTTYSKVV